LIWTIRGDSVDALLHATDGAGLRAPQTLLLPPIPREAYREIIEAPLVVANHAGMRIAIDPLLVDALVEASRGADALPMLAFTLRQLLADNRSGSTANLTLAQFQAAGRMEGILGKRLTAALRSVDSPPEALRRLILPSLATWDEEAKPPTAKRLVADEVQLIGDERGGLKPLADALVEARLLTRSGGEEGRSTLEVAHEALLRQPPISDWLAEDREFLVWRDRLGRTRALFDANARGLLVGRELQIARGWLQGRAADIAAADRDFVEASAAEDDKHRSEADARERALQARERAVHAAELERATAELASSRSRENAARMTAASARGRTKLVAALAGVIFAVLGFANQSYLAIQVRRLSDIYMPSVLTREVEVALKPRDAFQECASCPEMVVIPSGTFSLETIEQDDPDLSDEKAVAHPIIIRTEFAVSKFEITFDNWDACVAHGGCTSRPSDDGWGRGRHPVINVNWNRAKQYVTWLSKLTGKEYRLLTETEWEFAARGGTTTRWSFGDDDAMLDAYAWYMGNSNLRNHPVGEKKPNPFGLYDIHGGVTEWVEDCFNYSFKETPVDGSANISGDCTRRVVRGGSFRYAGTTTYSAYRDRGSIDIALPNIGFRIARTLKRKASVGAQPRRSVDSGGK
jgi:formylglycine-generating enzyme required for sulfatase activity